MLSRHVGDFGNVQAVENRGISVSLTDYVATLGGANSILDRTLVVSFIAHQLKRAMTRCLLCSFTRRKTILVLTEAILKAVPMATPEDAWLAALFVLAHHEQTKAIALYSSNNQCGLTLVCLCIKLKRFPF